MVVELRRERPLAVGRERHVGHDLAHRHGIDELHLGGDPKPWMWTITDPDLAGRPGWANT
jgi:hypothetical protein